MKHAFSFSVSVVGVLLLLLAGIMIMHRDCWMFICLITYRWVAYSSYITCAECVSRCLKLALKLVLTQVVLGWIYGAEYLRLLLNVIC